MTPDPLATPPQLITTGDGSLSLFQPALNETYHSVHGALRESRHVFIEHGLGAWTARNKTAAHLRIFEVGFGTGLNALLAVEFALTSGCSLFYETLEAYPIDESVWSLLRYPVSPGAAQHFESLHLASWDQPFAVVPGFEIEKKRMRLQEFEPMPDGLADVVFYDAFAPSRQPEMWQPDMLRRATGTLKAGGVLVTYCARGQFKRDLRSLGMNVETLQGPPGKKEMVRAWKE